jgi:transcriptional regulator with XRE-family HTH domain
VHNPLDFKCARNVQHLAMHLSQYMAAHDLSDEDVAKAVKLHRVSISRYRRGKERPAWDVVERIFKWSGGSVTANDWLSASARRRVGEAAE